MPKDVGHIKNPLTVISIFAGIAEISGTVILPFIEVQNQATYIWFLMLFPPFLVGIFFATLNWNHKALYAPSDYQNEDNFLNPIGKATKIESFVKLEDEVNELVSHSQTSDSILTTDINPLTAPSAKKGTSEVLQSVESAPHTTTASAHKTKESQHPLNSPISPLPNENAARYNTVTGKGSPLSLYERNRLSADIKLTEELAIKNISRLTGLPFKRDVTFSTETGKTIIFDAAFVEKNRLTVIEVKLFKSKTFNPNRIHKTIMDCLRVIRDDHFYLNHFTLYLVIVTDDEGAERIELERKIRDLISNIDMHIELRLMTMDELEVENQPTV